MDEIYQRMKRIFELMEQYKIENGLTNPKSMASENNSLTRLQKLEIMRTKRLWLQDQIKAFKQQQEIKQL